MRSLSAAVLAVGLCLSARAADVEFVRVWPGWQDADSFRRISEYFTGVENTGDVIIRRTQTATRSGYYFLVRVKHPNVALGGARFILHFISPYAPEPQQKAFNVDAPPGEHVFDLGLTGGDWTGRSAHLVAWKLELVSADGRLLASAESFLWSKPPGDHD
jgi:hypothetical protein